MLSAHLILLIVSAVFFVLAGFGVGSPYRLECFGWAFAALSFAF
jgi:hypothetical protein